MTARISRPLFAIILHTSKNKGAAVHPVVLRITFLGRRKYYTLGKCRAADWNSEAGRYRKNQDENIRLGIFEQRAKRILDDFEDTEKEFTFDRFEKEFFTDANMKRVLVFIDDEISKLKEADRAGAHAITKTMRNSLARFRGNKDFSFVDLDRAFLEKFEAFLLKTCSINGAAVYMRHLRAIFNRAIIQGLAKRENYPFADFHIKAEVTRKRALTKDQITAIINYETEEGTRLFHSKNYFIFSYLTRGMNFADLSRLRPENIIDGRINYIRAKTKSSRSRGDGRAFSIPLRGLVKEMIAYYRKNHFTGGGYLFPILTKKYESKISERWAIQKKAMQTNEDIQTICGKVKIPSPELVTFYAARHSWATITKLQGTSTELIQEGLGHGNVKTTEIYLGQFANEDLDKADSHLDEFKMFSVKKSG